MPYQDTVFGGLMKAFPRWRFDKLVERHRADYRVRRLSSWSQLQAMVFCQLSGSRSLRETVGALERFPGCHAHLGLEPVRRSTLADANRVRPAALFEDVLEALVGELGRRGGRRGKEMLRLIDATRVMVGKRIESWEADGAVKLHVVYDPGADAPVCFAVTSVRMNDITPAKRFPIEPGATYVFDKGYYDFGFWAALDAEGCRFVTRLKKNSPTRTIETRATEPEGPVLADRVARLSTRLASSRSNPFDKPVRLIDVRIDSGRVITLLSNDLDAPAEEIAALYKQRWQIELFFKWIKQNLKIRHFLGASENAVRIQIVTALIAYLLLRLAQIGTETELGLQAIARLVAKTTFQRRALTDLFEPPPDNPKPHDQLQIPFAKI
ncbi:MAG: IS4 family transposase [Rhodospirillaceae bacterium]|nr:IS4 family transposase [Rhodospirillaceae bacterium]